MKTSFIFIVTILFYLSVFSQPTDEISLANEYFNDGEYEKALEIYQKLQRNQPNNDLFIYRISDAYIALKQNNDALDFVNKLIKKHPQKPHYVALKTDVLDKMKKEAEAESLREQLIFKQLKTIEDFTTVGHFFHDRKDYLWTEKTYLQGRKILKNDALFSNELVFVFASQGKYEQTVSELISQYLENKAVLTGIRAQIVQFTHKENANEIEKALTSAQQKFPNDLGIKEILYDFYLQSAQYSEALIQARSLDKQQRENGERLHKLAFILQNNHQYDLSNEALDYIIKNHKNSPFYLQAFFEKAKNFELQAFEKKPLDTTAIYQAIKNYDELFAQFGRKEAFADAMYRKAKLCIFYINNLETGLKELEEIQKLSVPVIKMAESQLLIGDILLIKGEHNPAKIKYAEVEEKFKEGQIGAMAKFRSARLAYFKGDFEMSKARLKTLKDNTSDDIANDAIELFLLIQDNTGMDSTTTALQQFAKAQLLIYRKLYDQAMPILDSILYHFPNHALTDDILWEKTSIFLNRNNIEQALFFIEKILTSHPTAVAADDALYTKAEIYQFHLKNTEISMKLYLQLLAEYPASLYKVEARKRIRRLRGDEVKVEN